MLFFHIFFQVGLLDADLCGPSIPTMLNIEDRNVLQCEEGYEPRLKSIAECRKFVTHLHKTCLKSLLEYGPSINDVTHEGRGGQTREGC